ncbi:MAG: glycosyltransferase family 1 protein [Chlorobiaceae bacterium]|nr:glycosyltransferase family 1 protein [Chlorobiaceae bacterium]
MKIAIYSGSYVKDKDGAVRSIYQLVSSMKKAGHEVAVWSPDTPLPDGGSQDVHRVPSIPVPVYPDYRLGFCSGRTERELDGFSPDIIHISTPDIVGHRFLRYARKRGLPVASAFHTDFPSYFSYYHLGFAEKYAWDYLVKFYNSCDVVLAPNDVIRAKLIAKGIGKVELWSRGVDKALFDPSRRSDALRRTWGAEEKTVFVYAGRFVLYKDVETVIGIYRRFMDEGLGDRVKFVMIGSGPAEAQMRSRMPEAVFTGYLTGPALPEAYASGDVFLFPSTTEAFCNVVLEALASGLPSVVSDVGGCMDLVRRSGAGFVANAGDIDGYHDACLQLMQDRAVYDSMRALGLEFADGMSWSTVNGALIERYCRMASASSSRNGIQSARPGL